MKTLEITGKNISDAIENALKELQVNKDDIEYEVIEEGSRGLFNLIGSKPAKIIVKVKRDYIKQIKTFLSGILERMGVESKVDIKEEQDVININLSGPDMGIVIGYRGETLDSIQYLASLVVNKEHDIPYKKVILDVENYRKKREETLINVAKKSAYKVRKNKRQYKLEPMSPYERRLIHATLQNEDDIITFSEGKDPYRKVVIDIKR